MSHLVDVGNGYYKIVNKAQGTMLWCTDNVYHSISNLQEVCTVPTSYTSYGSNDNWKLQE